MDSDPENDRAAWADMKKAKNPKSRFRIFVYPLAFGLYYLVTKYFDGDRYKAESIFYCIVMMFLAGYTVVCYKKFEKFERYWLVGASLVALGVSFLLFLKAFIFPDLQKVNLIAIVAPYVLGLLLCVPSILSLPLLFLFLFGKAKYRKSHVLESPFKIKWLNRIAVICFSLLGILISLFFIAAVIIVLWIENDRLSLPWVVVAVVFYCSYWSCFFSVVDLEANYSLKRLFYQPLLDLLK